MAHWQIGIGTLGVNFRLLAPWLVLAKTGTQCVWLIFRINEMYDNFKLLCTHGGLCWSGTQDCLSLDWHPVCVPNLDHAQCVFYYLGTQCSMCTKHRWLAAWIICIIIFCPSLPLSQKKMLANSQIQCKYSKVFRYKDRPQM